jgi:hypothetical protein
MNRCSEKITPEPGQIYLSQRLVAKCDLGDKECEFFYSNSTR